MTPETCQKSTIEENDYADFFFFFEFFGDSEDFLVISRREWVKGNMSFLFQVMGRLDVARKWTIFNAKWTCTDSGLYHRGLWRYRERRR